MASPISNTLARKRDDADEVLMMYANRLICALNHEPHPASEHYDSFEDMFLLEVVSIRTLLYAL